MPENTEVQSIAEIVEEGSRVAEVVIAGGEASAIRVGDNESIYVIDQSSRRNRPERPTGTIVVHDGESFASAVLARLDPDRGDLTVYANDESLMLTAVLNDDEPGKAGWRDYRVEWRLRKTPEWDEWERASGTLMGQERYATFIEDHLDQIKVPSPSTMLELAQTFEATMHGRYKQQSRLGTGARALVYEEEIEQGATSTEGTNLVLPEKMELAMRPFYGAVVFSDDDTYVEGLYPVDALVKFKIEQHPKGLQIGHKLVRPDEVLRQAFSVLVEQVGEALEAVPLKAPAPPAVHGRPLVSRNVT